MPNYRGHLLFNTLFALPLLLGLLWWYLLAQEIHMLTFGFVFTYSTLFMSPDLDLASHIKPGSLRGVLSMPFRLYARYFRHRGLSHSIFLGSLTRILWLGGFVVCVLFFVCCGSSLFNGHELIRPSLWKGFFDSYQTHIKYGLGGVCCADWCHILLDHESSCW